MVLEQIDTVFQTLQTRFLNEVVANIPELGVNDVVFDNDKRLLPETGLRIRLTIRFSNDRQVSIGSRTSARFRTDGIMTAQVFDDSGTGPERVNKVYAQIAKKFPGRDVSGVHLLSATPTYVGHSQGAYQLNVLVPFWYDSLRNLTS